LNYATDEALDDATEIAGPDTFVPSLSLVRDERDGARYQLLTRLYAYTLYAALALAIFNLIPAWTLAVIVPFVYLRMALALHELLHARTAHQVPRFHQLTMIFESPMCLGYREHRAVHFAHHRFSSTDRDPELYQIAGGPVRAFGNAMISPERGFIHWVSAHGLGRGLAIDAGIRCAAFVTIAAISPRVFLIYWLALRVSVGIASFVFHHVLHNAHGRLGTFPLPVSAAAVRVARVVFGAEPMLILTEHERHHSWPRVRARDLPLLPEPRA
jgi:hypothetical protein